MNTGTLNRSEVGAVRALAPERGTRPARVMRRIAPLADNKLPWFAASTVLLASKGRQAVVPVALGWAAVGLSSLVAVAVVEPLAQRRRPQPARLKDHVRTGDEPSSSSMPSTHTASGVAFAAVVTAELPRAGWPLLPLAGVIALGRVVSARHFPTDVVAGAVLGGAAGGVVLAAARYARSHPGTWLGPLLRVLVD